MGLFGNETHTFRRLGVQHGTLEQQFRAFLSLEGAARHAWATLSRIFVARGCSAARLSDTSALLRRPRVRHDTFRRHFRPFSLPVGVGQNDVRMNGTLRQRNPYFSSPKSKIRYAWVTLPSIFVARECSTTLSGNTSAHFRRSKVPHGTLRQRNPHFPSPGGLGYFYLMS